jgi:hypothetical protein
MLLSEVKGWHYYISWDNPSPANSQTMLKALGELGKVTKLETKTSVALAPYANTHWSEVRSAIKENLHARNGNAFYVNLRTGKAFQISAKAGLLWKSAAAKAR